MTRPHPRSGDAVRRRGSSGVGVVAGRANFIIKPDGSRSSPAFWIKYPDGHGVWLTLDEIELVP